MAIEIIKTVCIIIATGFIILVTIQFFKDNFLL